MQVFRQIDTKGAALVGWGLHVLLLAPELENRLCRTQFRLAGLGGIVRREVDVFNALDAVNNAQYGYGLFVVECDSFGGMAAGRQIIAMLRKGRPKLPAILLSCDCDEQIFPAGQHDPIELRAPATAVALRVGFEHALRDRLIYSAA